MPTIRWKPFDLTRWNPGQKLDKGGADVVTTLHDADRWIQNFCRPLLFSFITSNQTVSPRSDDVGLGTSATSAQTLARLIVHNNKARHPLRLDLIALVTDTSTTGTVTVNYAGGSSTGLVTVTTAGPMASIVVTPSATHDMSSPNEVTIKGHAAGGGTLIIVCGSGHLEPADRPDGGAGADGYIPLYDIPTNRAIPTEWVGRGYNNMRSIARDRVACLATLIHGQNIFSSRSGDWISEDTAPKALGRVYVMGCDNVKRAGVVSFYVGITGATGKAYLIAGTGNNTIHTISSSGWIHQDIEIPKAGCFVTVYGEKDSASGVIALLSLQVFRKAI